MNDTIIAAKAKEQHENFLGKVFTHFSKPKARFIREATYGIQASGDTKLSSIVRAIEDDVTPIQTEKRLSRNIDDETLEREISAAILSEGARHVRKDTLILVDPTEIRKEYAYKMEYVTRVRDASRSSKEGRDVVVNGYHGCIAAACTSGSRKTIPLALKLWSSRAPGFKGENDEVLKIINDIFEATGGKGVVVYDRGGDRPAFYGDFIEKGRDFIVRVKSRSVLSWNGLHEISFLAENCTMQHHHHVTFDSHGRECNIQMSFGTMPARLPMFPDRQLHLVVVKGFGQQPMMLLTSLPVDASFKSQWRIVEGYLSRWRIEETIRFIKQEYGFENIRVHSYNAIRNMASLVLACAYFATVWIGRHLKRQVLAEHLAYLNKRLNEVPQFGAYAITSGLKRAFSAFGRLVRSMARIATCTKKADLSQYLPGFAELLDLDDG